MADVAARQLTEADFEPLDMQELQALPNEFKERYSLLERLFGDKAWTLVKGWCQKSADQQLQAVLLAPNWEQTVYARGKRDAFIELMNMEKGVAFQFREIIRESVERALEMAREDEEAANE